MNRVFLNKFLLQDLSERTGGTFLHWDSRDQVGELVALEEKRVSFQQTIQLSHWWPLLLAGFILLAGEWVARRLTGLQ